MNLEIYTLLPPGSLLTLLLTPRVTVTCVDLDQIRSGATCAWGCPGGLTLFPSQP